MIVGGGIVGLATAYRMISRNPDLEVTVLEKEPGVARHQSTHNSGVLHAGLYYKPGSSKARLAVSGIRQMTEFCREHGLPYEICGKLVVAVDEGEVARLRDLEERGRRNGLRGIRWLTGPEIREIEPHCAGVAAVQVPEEGIVDYAAVCDALHREIVRRGGAVHTSTEMLSAREDGAAWRIETTKGDHEAGFLVNCAGLHSDRVAAASGERRAARIVPFRGEYFKLRKGREHLVRNLIYPVPDPSFPFLGVHFTRMIHGGVEAGPNAVLAFAREGYRKSDLKARDLFDAMSYPGLWRFFARHRRMCWMEARRSLSKALFCRSLQRLVPEVQESDLEPGGAGVRAQAMSPEGELLQDFVIIRRRRALHLLNAPSPGATASLAIGGEIADQIHSLPL